jgi:hypothetical protein
MFNLTKERKNTTSIFICLKSEKMFSTPLEQKVCHVSIIVTEVYSLKNDSKPKDNFVEKSSLGLGLSS